MLRLASVPTEVVRLRGRVRGMFYGWWLVLLSGLVMIIATVPLFHAMSVWAVALERSFGWNRTQLSLALTFTRVEGGVMGPIEGYLSDKLGPRRMVFIGLLVLGGGFVLLSQTQNLWMFYLAYVIMSVGQGLGGWIPLMTLLNRWFVRRRGIAMGWTMMMGNGLGALLLVPAIAWAINPDHDRVGWRLTAFLLGLFIIAIAFPAARSIRNRPQDMGLLPDGDPPARGLSHQPQRKVPATAQRAGSPDAADFTVAQAMRAPSFWFIAFGHGFGSMVIIAVMAHLGLFMGDAGFNVEQAGLIVSLYLMVATGFQIVGGYVGDRIPKNLALFGFTALQGLAVLILAFAPSLAMIYVFAVLFGIGFGGRVPLTTAIRGEYFGQASFGKILGVSTAPMNVLLIIAAPMAGAMRDMLGDYTLAFITLAGLNSVGAILFLMARRPRLPARQPQVSGRQEQSMA